MLENWIKEENLRPLFEFASSCARYGLDDLDWDAITHGITTTDAETGDWFAYPLAGETTIEVWAARDRGTTVIHVRLNADEHTLSQLATAIGLMQDYVLLRNQPQPGYLPF